MRALLILPLVLGLTGCNWLSHVTGLSKGSDQAVGAACRQTGRSLEECYQLNPDCDKGQVFAGWRDMQDYMVKEKLPTMSPPPPPPPPPIPVAASVPSAGAQKNSDNNQGGAAPSDTGAQGNAPDPEVQAVLDTINNRSEGASTAAQPSSAEQQQLKQMLDKMSGNVPSSGSGKKKKNN